MFAFTDKKMNPTDVSDITIKRTEVTKGQTNGQQFAKTVDPIDIQAPIFHSRMNPCTHSVIQLPIQLQLNMVLLLHQILYLLASFFQYFPPTFTASSTRELNFLQSFLPYTKGL